MRKVLALAVSVAVITAVFAIIFSVSSASDVRADDSEDNLVLVISGMAKGEMRDISGTMMNCFDVDLLDPESGESVGSGTDCFDGASITPIGDDGGFEVNNVQFFHLDDGTIVVGLRSTVQPAGPGSPDLTHYTGATPAAGEPNQIISGTGDFEDAEGRVLLNGGVDLSLFESDNIITFDCVFRIEVNDDDD